ncbi:hypothetical protein C8R47DRAFT_1245863 [Mycena vitilis]|nr:hypothetical protein C8R47DRAFT_1245863 [Mycena vitilis]
MRADNTQLISSILLGSLSLIPNNPLRYVALASTVAFALLYHLHFGPTAFLLQLAQSIKQTEEVFEQAKSNAMCPRDRFSLAAEWIRLLEVKRSVSETQCRLWAGGKPSWKQYWHIHRRVADCVYSVDNIRTAVQLWLVAIKSPDLETSVYPTAMVAARLQRPAPYSMTSSECSIPIRRIINYNESGDDDSRLIRVQNTHFRVSPRILQAGSSRFKTILKSRESPIMLSGHSSAQFRAFLGAVYAQQLPSARTLDITRLCSIAEVSYKYEFYSLKLWSMEGVAALVNAPNSLLRTAPSETFVRLIRLALLYRDANLSRSVQSKWLTRIHWHDLDPAPALVIADAYDLRQLLCHAYYVHLVNAEPRISRAKSIGAGSPLTPTQNLHRQLQEAPPAFEGDGKCDSHERCLLAWKARWAFEIGRSSLFAPLDVLRRLLFMEGNLGADEVFTKCMSAGCRKEALYAIAKKRAEISENLHHHFDL